MAEKIPTSFSFSLGFLEENEKMWCLNNGEIDIEGTAERKGNRSPFIL
jgi:hypothetical protein